MNILTELKNRGVQNVLFVSCDGLKGLPDSIQATWPMATVQTCVVHLVRNSLRFASRKYWKPIADHLKKVYQAPTVKAAEQQFDEFAKEWEPIYPAMIAMWRRSWDEFTPFLDYPGACPGPAVCSRANGLCLPKTPYRAWPLDGEGVDLDCVCWCRYRVALLHPTRAAACSAVWPSARACATRASF